MPNAASHRLGAAITIGAISAYSEHKNGQNTLKPLRNAALAAACGTLPDILEPALHPNHRRFFHSVGFAGLLGYGMYKLYKWETDDEFERFLKGLALVAGGSYLVHLAMDASTPKSLPVL